jgi:hypothetical protein
MKKLYSVLIIVLIVTQSLLAQNYTAFKADTAPVIDGVGDDYCWSTVPWALINHPFDGGALPDSANYYGRFKAVWTPSRLYFLMEITDDSLVDLRVNPKDNYWEDDCAEFFLNEDHKPHGHECGDSAFNAFAYHIAATARDKNNYTNGSILPFTSPDAVNHVVDLGYDCNTNNVLDLDDHVNVKIRKDGHKYTWELEFKIFDKTYDQNSTSNVPVTLTPKKVIGFAIAYCDDDDGSRDHMIGTIPNHNDYSGPYPCYRFTNDFGALTLDTLDKATSVSKVFSEKKTNENFVYPNPAKDKIYLNINSEKYTNVQILDIYGRCIMSVLTINNTGIDVSKLTNGVYFVKAGSRVEKILIE